jgi:hypothetical protein
LKAANPRLKVLAYLNLSAMSYATASGASTGVATPLQDWNGTVTDAGAAYGDGHGNWYLHTRSGQRFRFWGYDWLWAANIADPGYQRQWADNAARLLAAHPEFDGIFIDDVNPTIRYHWDTNDVRELPTDAAYQAATGAALAAITPRIHALGRLAYANLGAWADYGDQVRPWLSQLDGAMDEMWVKWGDGDAARGWRDEAGWARQVANVAAASAAGVTVLTVTHSTGTDAAAARYGYASALLASRGTVLFEATDDYHTETWFHDYDTNLGAPTSAMTEDASGVRRRGFTRGLVLVNPTADTRSVQFGGAFSGDGLKSATAAKLPGHSALILTADRPDTLTGTGLAPPTLTAPRA